MNSKLVLFLSALSLSASGQTTIFLETFGTTGFYEGPANGYTGMDNPSTMYTEDEIIVQDWNPSDYDGASANGHIFVWKNETEANRPVFTITNINTSEYEECRLSFGTASWWGLPANWMTIRYSTDGEEWTEMDKFTIHEGDYATSPGGEAPWGWVKLSDILPSTRNLRIRFTSNNNEQGFFLDDVAISGLNPDFEPPTQPADLSVSLVQPSSFLLKWSGSTDNQGIEGYDILQDGIVICNTSSTSALVKYLQPGGSNDYTIIAYDLSGNPSAPSTSVNVALPDYPVEQSYSWETAHAEVLPAGDLAWAPEEFVYEEGPSVRYIDFEGGNDTNDGLTTSTAWKHHPWDGAAAGNAAASAGIHTYVFKRGVVYRGFLTARESGEYDNPVRLTSSPDWGTGEACIYGSKQITGGWTKADQAIAPDIPDASKVWYRDISGLEEPKVVCEVNGPTIKRVRVARIPNYKFDENEPMKHWWAFTGKNASDGQLHLTDTRNLTQSDPDFYKGGDVWATEDVIVMCTLWKQAIQSWDPASDKIVVSSTDFGGVDCKYYIENTPFLLDTTSEFYFDEAKDRMFLRLDVDKDPNSTTIEIANRAKLIDINAKSNIVISGLTFGFTTYNQVRYGTGDGVPAIMLDGACTDIEIKNCTFRYLNGGILANGSTNSTRPVRDITISDNEMNFMDDFAILMNSTTEFYLHDIDILRNKIYENGTRHLGRWYSSIPAINCQLISGEIAGNIIDYSWGGGIIIFWGKGSGSNLNVPFVRGFMHHNKVSHSLIGVNDYGGIESWQGGPAFIYNNISYDASGLKYNWNISLGYNFYLDGTFKNAVFNNIAYGRGWNKSHGAYMQVLGYYNLYAHNLAYNIHSFTFGGDNALSIDGQNIYLANVSDSNHYQFNHTTKPSGLPFDSFGYNIFSRTGDFQAKAVSGSELKDFDAFVEEINSYEPGLGQVGYEAYKPVLANPSAEDFSLHAASEAIDRGVKFFLPFPLSKVVGEWHFYKHNADPAIIKSDNFYFTSDFDNRETYNNVPKNRLTAHGLTDTSFVVGDLEDWTTGALQFDGFNTWCSLSHSEASAFKSNNVDMTTNSFILEVYMKTAVNHASGVLISKFNDSGYGYRLDIDESGYARITIMNGNSPAYSVSSNTMVNDEKWHHILGEVNRRGTVNLYLDGKLSNGSPTGVLPASDISLSNEADLLIGRDNEGNYFEGIIDFIRISKGLLRDARTTIDELYTWQTDGPFLYDMRGNKPIDQRDAGPLEFGAKLCEMVVDPNPIEFESEGVTGVAEITAAGGFEIIGQSGDFFTHDLTGNELSVTVQEFDRTGTRSGYVKIYGCNETQKAQVIQSGVPCQFNTDIPDTIYFDWEADVQSYSFSTNGQYDISREGNLHVTINPDEINNTLIFRVGRNLSNEIIYSDCVISGCDGPYEFVVQQVGRFVSVNERPSGEFRIWPNPVADNMLKVTIPEELGKCRITMTDLAGSVFYRESLYPGENEVDVNLQPGTYFINIRNSNESFTSKIVFM